MCQDNTGIIWIGTYNGLYKYDGYKIKRITSVNHHHSFESQKIRNLYIDRRGQMWMATLFDGFFIQNPKSSRYYNYHATTDNGFLNNDIHNFQEDHAGNIWITSKGGISILPKEDLETFYTLLENDNQTDISDLYTFFPFSFSTVDTTWSDGQFATGFTLDLHNNLWIATNFGLYVIPASSIANGDIFGSNFEFQKFDFGYIDANYIHDIVHISGDIERVFVGTKSGVKIITFDTSKDYPIDKDYTVNQFEGSDENSRILSSRLVRAMHKSEVSQKEELWIGTEKGLIKYSLQEQSNIPDLKIFKASKNNPNTLKNDIIQSLFEDRSGVLWIGTRSGVNKINLSQKQIYKLEPGKVVPANESGNIINGMTDDRQGNLWLGTFGGGIYKIPFSYLYSNINSENTNKSDPAKAGPVRITFPGLKINKYHEFVHAVVADHNGNIWFGTGGAGLIGFNLKKGSNEVNQVWHFTKANTDGTLGDDYISSLLIDDKGKIWIGTFDEGIFSLSIDRKKNQYFFHSHSKVAMENDGHYPIATLYQDHADRLWIGSRGGGLFVSALSNGDGNQLNFELFDLESGNPASLTKNFITCIYEDKNGGFWVGSSNGLYNLDRRTKSYKMYSNADGLTDDHIQSIIEDKEGNIWVSTETLISKLTITENGIIGSDYNRSHGLGQIFFKNNSSAKLNNDIICFGGNDGLVFFKPSEIEKSKSIPSPLLTGFKIFNQTISAGDTINRRILLTNSLSHTQEIALKFKENTFSFEYTLPHYIAPEFNRFAVKLEGQDPDWIYQNSNNRLASYTNVHEGRYDLVVKASDNDGIWSEETTLATIVVSPPIWRTNWAFILYAIAFGLILLLFRKVILIRASFVHDLKYERMTRQNSEEVNQTKLRFFTNVSHEFRTPLTLIIGPLEKLLEEQSFDTRIKKELNIVHRNAHRLLRLITQLMDFRKVEAGKMEVSMVKGDMHHFLEEVQHSFDFLAKKKNIQFRFIDCLEEKCFYFDPDKLDKILFNLISNSLKFTDHGGKIELGLNYYQKDPNSIEIYVKDNGIGIESDRLGHIFQRFYHTDGKELFHQTGTGIGLALSKDLVELQGGQLIVQSEKGSGSKFSVILPDKRSEEEKDRNTIADYESTEELHSNIVLPEVDVENVDDQLSDVEYNANETEKEIILVVDDDKDIIQFVREVLGDQYTIIETYDGEDGLEKSKAYLPSIIISDIMMPKMDGIELCSAIKNEWVTSHIPVILLTAKSTIENRIQGLNVGADSYIPKPFNPKHLKIRVSKLIELRQKLKFKFGKGWIKTDEKRVGINQDEKLLIQLKKVVEENISDPEFGIDQLTRELSISKTQLYRKLKAITGMRINQMVKQIKLHYAAQLLKDSDLTVAEVTYQVGFSDLKYFRNSFKKEFGVNPSELK